MRTKRPWGVCRKGSPRLYLVLGLLSIVALIPAAFLYSHGQIGGPRATAPVAGRSGGTLPHQTPSASPAAAPTAKPAAAQPAKAILCVGSALTNQAEVLPNTSYCGGHATSRLVLADGDTWTNGEVSGVTTGRQQGAVQCGNPCTLVDMNIHDNPRAFAGIYAPFGSLSGPMIVRGGRVSGSGSLGIGGSGMNQLTIVGVEIDHNGASANCGFEGGGFKGINHGSRFTDNYVHDNHCPGVWYDINAANNVIDHNRVVNNAGEGIFYEISHDSVISGNVVQGNGFGTNGNSCKWLWGGGITIASSSNVQVYGNNVNGNCNGITGTQQNRADSTSQHLLANLSIHDNRVSGAGKTGVAADNGADLTTRNIVFAKNSYSAGTDPCGFAC